MSSDKPQSVELPIKAYLEVIRFFMDQNGYFTEKVPEYKDGIRGKYDWSKTIRKKRPLIQTNGTPVYIDYIVRVSAQNDRNMITQIHKFCVYESFVKLGWLFTPYLPEKPTIFRDNKLFLTVLRDKLSNTYIDRDKQLFQSMIAMIEYLDYISEERNFYYGTNRFEYIWEKLIDQVFGIRNKMDYFPRTRWMLRSGKSRINAALEPDTIMLHNNKIYVIDAKFYKFGITGNPADLPESSSINKQITYGEYIASQEKFIAKYGDNVPVFNAFLIPYNAHERRFGTNSIFLNIGEATGDWKNSGKKYEKVQGILVDIRFLMHHHVGNHDNQIKELALSIESAFEKSLEI